jgi:hypothetical protein
MKSYSANMFVSLLTTDQQQHNNNNFDHFSEPFRDTTELNDETTPTTTIIIDNSTNTNKKIVILTEGDTRETWTNNCDYLITTLGGLIGLGKTFVFFEINNEYIDEI